MSATRNGAVKSASKTTRRATAAAAKSADHLTDRMHKIADTAIDGAEAQVVAAREAAEKYLRDGRETIGSVSDYVRAYVKAQPVKSLAIAAGAGMFLSMFLRRR